MCVHEKYHFYRAIMLILFACLNEIKTNQNGNPFCAVMNKMRNAILFASRFW